MKKKIFSLILSFTFVLSVFVSFSIAFAAPASAVSYTADSSWYDANKSVLEINDIPDFVAFMNKLDELGSDDNGGKFGAAGNLAAIRWEGKMPFEGQTIVLNTDIILNPGITFKTTGPDDSSAFKFSRTARQIGFGGIFDGQGHTISGLYITAAKGAAGSIFGVAGAATKRTNVVVRNLQIKNSLITNANMGAATIFSSVAFNSTALIQNVYSEAFVRCTATGTSTDSKLKATITGVNMGGFCATVGGTLTIDSSVYAGTFSTASGGGHKKYVGGMVGNITNKKLNDGIKYSGTLNVENSAYYGYYAGNGVYLGKISGTLTSGAAVNVNNSIFLGTMKSTASVNIGSGATSKASTYYVGMLIGDATSNFTLTGKGNVASASLRGSTNVTENYNTTSTSGFTADVSVTETAASALKGAGININSVLSGLGRYWVANGTRGEFPVPSSFILLYGAESLKYDYINPMTVTTYGLAEQLGAKKPNGGVYTEESYRAYSDAYASIIGKIFKSGADLTAIDIPSLKSAAEAKLQTPVQARRAELKATLGSKIINSGEKYVADSYSAYSAAYDEIVTKLDNATTVAALNAIDVATLKTNAEAKLVTVADAILAKRAELLSTLGAKKTNEGAYTDDSYALYSSAYDSLIAEINGATSIDDISTIDALTAKADIEALLVDFQESDENDNTSEPDTTEPDTSEPDTSEPDTSEPDTSEPDTTEPDTTEPDTSEPDTTEPDTTEPDTTEPDTSEPDTSEPDTTEPDTTEPDTSEPDTTEPDASVDDLPYTDGDGGSFESGAVLESGLASSASGNQFQKKGVGCGSSLGLTALAIVSVIGAAGVMLAKKRR